MPDDRPASSAVDERARNRPSGSEKRARGQLINVRINADERARWTAFAASKGMSLAGLLRLSVEAALLEARMQHAAQLQETQHG